MGQIELFIIRVRIIIAVTVSLGTLCTSSICYIFHLCIESNALKKSTNSSVALRFFANTFLMIRQIITICEVVKRFLQKPF